MFKYFVAQIKKSLNPFANIEMKAEKQIPKAFQIQFTSPIWVKYSKG